LPKLRGTGLTAEAERHRAYRTALTPDKRAAQNKRQRERSALERQDRTDKGLPASRSLAGDQKACPFCKEAWGSNSHSRAMRAHLQSHAACATCPPPEPRGVRHVGQREWHHQTEEVPSQAQGGGHVEDLCEGPVHELGTMAPSHHHATWHLRTIAMREHLLGVSLSSKTSKHSEGLTPCTPLKIVD